MLCLCKILNVKTKRKKQRNCKRTIVVVSFFSFFSAVYMYFSFTEVHFLL